MTNNIQERTWESVLAFEEFNLEELYTNSGIRDVLTSLTRNGAEEPTGDVGLAGMTTMHGDGEGFASMIERIADMQEQEPEDVSMESLVRRALGIHGQGVNIQEEENIPMPQIDSIEDMEQREDNEMAQDLPEVENRISLTELFARQANLSDLDNNSEMSLRDMQDTELATTYTRPDVSGLMQSPVPIVEFGEDVLVARRYNGNAPALEFVREGYEQFNNEIIDERNVQLQRERIQVMEQHARKRQEIGNILRDMFGRDFENMYGYDKVGRYEDGRPYAKAVLSTRFSQLYDRRFRRQGELHSFSRNVAVANRQPSLKGFLELTIKGEENGDLVANIGDSEGERIEYLEQKLQWLQSRGVTADLWVLHLKTQYEFEDNITTLAQLKELEFEGQ